MLMNLILRPIRRMTSPGSAPGTVVAREGEPEPVIQVMAFSDGELFDKRVESVDELAALTESYRVTWINIEGLGNASIIEQLGEMFGLHRLALEDVMNPHQRAKVEEYDDFLFIVARMVSIDPRLTTEQICFFLGHNFVITVQEGKPGDCLDPVRERIRKGSGRIRHRGADYLTYALLDSIIDHYFPVLDTLGEELDRLDDELMNRPGEASISSIHQFRSQLLVLRRAMRPHREAINQLARDPHELIEDETRIFLRDCYDHTIQLGEAIDIYRETSSDLRDYHLSWMSNRTNDVMKTLTIIATIFIPLGFIAGLYGMNFENMPELHSRYGYPMILALMCAVAFGLVYWFKLKGWFDG